MKNTLVLFIMVGSVCLAGCVPPPDDDALSNIVSGMGGQSGVGVGGAGATVTGGSGGATGSGGDVATGGITGTDGGLTPDGGTGTGGGAAGRSGGRGGATGTGGVRGGGGGAPATMCSSGRTWSGGNGPAMRPGANCRSCHSFSVSGTVYPTAHEPTNCEGVNGSTGVRVILSGANGQTLTLTPTSAGNFYTNTSFGGSFTAKVTNTAGGTRAMASMQTTGDCNSCHTQNGSNGAPGRIMAP